MYVDIDSRNMISVHEITEDDALLLMQALNYIYPNSPIVGADRMNQLSNDLLDNFKKACKNGGTKSISLDRG